MFKIALNCVHNLVKTNQKSIKKDFLNGNAFNNLNNLIDFPYLNQSYYQYFYSYVPNRRAGPNKLAGWNFFKI